MKSLSAAAREWADANAAEADGFYDPPNSLPYLVNQRLKRKLLAWATERLPQGARVLDIGCARGDLLHQLGVVRPDLTLVGIDLVPGMVRVARKNYQELHLAQADGTHLPFETGTFDMVIVMHVLANLDPEEAAPAVVREACRVSKGYVCLELKNRFVLNTQLNIRAVMLKIPLLNRLCLHLFATPHDAQLVEVYAHNPRRLLAGLEEVGRLKAWSVLPTPAYFYLVKSPHRQNAV